VAPSDALDVIDYLNGQSMNSAGGHGEGESDAIAAAIDDVFSSAAFAGVFDSAHPRRAKRCAPLESVA
jgi:hypothetical protein